jgi:hypothetical protein
MTRTLVCIVLVFSSLGALPLSPSPSTRPTAAARPWIAARATTAPAPSLDELHAQAVELMRQQQYAKAAIAMKRVYESKPSHQQSRTVMLNQAIIDIAQKVNTPRTVRDLTAYLAAHREPDEFATNVLGSALNIAADTGRFRQTRFFSAGVKEWERRNYVLEQSRADAHRWGTKWLTPDEWDQLQKRRTELQREVNTQLENVARAQWQVDSLQATQRQILADAPIPTQRPAPPIYEDPGRGPIDPRELDRHRGLTASELYESRRFERLIAETEARKMDGEIHQAIRELQNEQQKLRAAQNSFPKPQWPMRFDPIEPTESTPLPIPQTAAPVAPQAPPVTTQPVTHAATR